MSERIIAARSRASLPLLIVVAIGLLWFIARNAGLLMLTGSDPAAALRLWPPSPHARIALATRNGFPPANGALPTVERQLTVAMRGAPLAAEPLFAGGMRSGSRGQHQLAILQLEEASRRNPRLVSAYLLLAGEYLRVGRTGDAVSEITTALRLGAIGSSELLMRTLDLMAGDPKAHAMLLRRLAANPPWRANFVHYISQAGADPGTLFEAVQASPTAEHEQKANDEQATFLSGLVAKGDYDRAYLAWVNFLPANALSRVSPIYDGSFRKLPGPPPFNWQLLSGDSASAEMIDGSRLPPGSALAVDFFGNARTQIARETTFNPPGNYALSIGAIGSDQKNSFGGSFVWEFTCLPGPQLIARLEFSGLGEQPIFRQTALTIPATNCMAQTLTLFGEPGETNAQVSAEFGAIALARK